MLGAAMPGRQPATSGIWCSVAVGIKTRGRSTTGPIPLSDVLSVVKLGYLFAIGAAHDFSVRMKAMP